MGKTAGKKIVWDRFIQAVKKDVVPALGCTEPISVAYAAAVGAEYLKKTVERIEGRVSANLLKNGMGVTVPGTGMTGLLIAAAVGAVGGDPKKKLEVLKDLTPEQVTAGKKMLARHLVKLDVAEVANILYAEVTVFHKDEYVRVCIADDHTHVISIIKNDKVLLAEINDMAGAAEADIKNEILFQGVRAKDVFDFSIQVPVDEISFIAEAGQMNASLSESGMKEDYGLKIGATMQRQIASGLMSENLLTLILMRTAAASDARMGGASLPAMTNSGSGNQGIAATMPVLVVAEHLQASPEEVIRALMLSHLMAIYIHDKLPKLSALCAVTTASMGAAAGMAWLFKRDFETVSMAISNMIGDVSGMICDGASNSCAMKVSTAAASAYKAVLLALEGTRVTGSEGIVDEDLDQSIINIGQIASKGMLQTDQQILEIMLNKKAI